MWEKLPGLVAQAKRVQLMTEESDITPMDEQARRTDVGLESIATEQKPIDWIELLSVIWNSRKLIASVVAITTVLAVIYSLAGC
jgi:hypothetical protein